MCPNFQGLTELNYTKQLDGQKLVFSHLIQVHLLLLILLYLHNAQHTAHYTLPVRQCLDQYNTTLTNKPTSVATLDHETDDDQL